MLYKEQFLKDHPSLRNGMVAYSEDGDKLGTIVELNDDSVTIEKGVFFPQDFTIRYDDIEDVRDSTVTINQKRNELQDWHKKDYAGWDQYEKANREAETRVPVHEEQLEARKVERPAGEVHIRKVVHTELKHFEIPVSSKAETATSAKAFKDEEITIPVSEEEVVVTKKPVVKEEVRIRKEAHEVREKVSGEVRKEEVVVERGSKNKHSK